MNALLCALLFVVPQSGAPDGATDGGFATLDNGLRYQCVHVPGARGVCVVLGVRVGTDHDPAGQTGLAASGVQLLRLWQESAPPADRLQVIGRGSATLLTATRQRGELDDALASLRPLLAGELEITDDMAHRARARAALTADSETKIFPGPILEYMARRKLLAGTPRGRQTCGVPDQIASLSDGAVRPWLVSYFRPRHTVLVVMGGRPQSELEAAVRAAYGGLAGGDAEPAVATVHDDLEPVVSPVVHDRVNGPFVTLALRVPETSAPDYAPFLIAMSVVRARAARALLEPRGGEFMARFPPMRYADDEGARLVAINRRGRDGEGMEPAQAELERFVEAMRADRVSADEIARATAEVSERFEGPPYPATTARLLWNARALYPRALLLATGEIVGWPDDLAARVRRTPPEQVHAVLDAALAPEGRCWLALIPPSMPAVAR